jgi:hypothetical protein
VQLSEVQLSEVQLSEAVAEAVDAEQEVECPSCYDDVHPSLLRAVPRCGHVLCVPCWRRYAATSVEGGLSCVDTRCPQHECKEVPPPPAPLYCCVVSTSGAGPTCCRATPAGGPASPPHHRLNSYHIPSLFVFQLVPEDLMEALLDAPSYQRLQEFQVTTCCLCC